tara:strand:+ start:4912 stop:6414 length:1503 start_codon:yes stop_codon:yes gene_type:complete
MGKSNTKKGKSNTKKGKSNTNKFNTQLCDNNMTFEDCELTILRHAVDETEELQGQKKVNSKEIQEMLEIVENFIIKKNLICYGGTAINNILPKYAQFYKRDIEIPDYDFFSSNALEDAKELADIYHKAGYSEVEAKSGIHYGTFKVFVNYIPIADITHLHKDIYKSITNDAIQIAGIKYAPPDYLRMSMYLELSRPAGDVSRWEKVMKRLAIMNKFHPMKLNKDCHTIDFSKQIDISMPEQEKLHLTLRDIFIDNGSVFFGGYSTHLYSKHMSESKKVLVNKIPDFDIISEDIDKCALIVKEQLQREKYKQIKIIKHDAIGEIIPKHIEITVGKYSMAFIYEPIACHSYNEITVDTKTVKVATIDTILAFYLSFLYAKMPHYDKDRLLCIAMFLFQTEQQNRLAQKGILKRFSINCYGKQSTLEDIRSIKSDKFKEFKESGISKTSKEYQMWFFKYNPTEKLEKPVIEKKKKNKTRKNKQKSPTEHPILALIKKRAVLSA